jgi:hypothetical protein
MRSRVLYLLVNSERPAFKIGVSISPHKRIASLPDDIAVSESYEVRFADDSAYRAELVMHHLFRHRRFDMPRGDGYTEWFDIAALPEVIQFITENGQRLGVEEVSALRERPVLVRPSSEERIAIQEAKRLRAEARSRNLAEQYERARETNAGHLVALKAWLAEVDAAGAFAGILRPRANKLNQSGYLYLKGPGAQRLAEKTIDPMEKWTTLVSGRGFGFSRILCSSQKMRHAWTEIAINRQFIMEGLADSNDVHFPGSEAVRELLISRAAELGTAEDKRLNRVRAVIEAQSKEFYAAFSREWLGDERQEVEAE